MNLKRVFILCLWVLCTLHVKAQISGANGENVQCESNSANVDNSAPIEAEVSNQDSLNVAQLQQLLEEAKLSEANLKMEF